MSNVFPLKLGKLGNISGEILSAPYDFLNASKPVSRNNGLVSSHSPLRIRVDMLAIVERPVAVLRRPVFSPLRVLTKQVLVRPVWAGDPEILNRGPLEVARGSKCLVSFPQGSVLTRTTSDIERVSHRNCKHTSSELFPKFGRRQAAIAI